MNQSENYEQTEGSSPGGVGRRTIVKGAAWSIPVIAAAVAVPDSVASPSGGATVTLTLPGTGGACLDLGAVVSGGTISVTSDGSAPVSAPVTLTFAGSTDEVVTYAGVNYPVGGSSVVSVGTTNAAGQLALGGLTAHLGGVVTITPTAVVGGTEVTGQSVTVEVCQPCSTTFSTGNSAIREMVVDSSGNVYVGNWGGTNRVTRIAPDGTKTDLGLWSDGVLGLTLDPTGTYLVVSHGYGSGTANATRYDLASGTRTELLPSGAVVYAYGGTFAGNTFYQSDYRDGAGGKIVGVDLTSGATSTFANRTNLQAIVDIISDGSGGFYASRWNLPQLVHIAADGTESVITNFSDIGGVFNYFSVQDGYAYVGLSGGSLWRVDLATGVRTELCGPSSYWTSIVPIPGTKDAYAASYSTGQIERLYNVVP